MTTNAPVVHLNGTSKEQLVADYYNQYEALTNALRTLERYPPNARDYYVLGGLERFDRAMAAHTARLKDLARMREEVYDILCAVQDQ